MKEFNLDRLMNSCCIRIDDEVFDPLFNYLIDMDVDLNTLNIDDIYVNYVSYINKDELSPDCFILLEDDDGAWIIE